MSNARPRKKVSIVLPPLRPSKRIPDNGGVNNRDVEVMNDTVPISTLEDHEEEHSQEIDQVNIRNDHFIAVFILITWNSSWMTTSGKKMKKISTLRT